MSRRRRRREAEELAQRFKELRPEDARSIMLVLVGNAFISSAVQVVLVASYVRAARRALRARRNGSRLTVHGALSRPVVAITCGHVIHLICTQTLLSRWTRRAVLRAEASAQPPEDQSRTP